MFGCIFTRHVFVQIASYCNRKHDKKTTKHGNIKHVVPPFGPICDKNECSNRTGDMLFQSVGFQLITIAAPLGQSV